MLIKCLIPRAGAPIATGAVTVFVGLRGVRHALVLQELLQVAMVTGESAVAWEGTILRDVQLVSPLNEERLLSGLVPLPGTEDRSTHAGLNPTLDGPLQIICPPEAWSLLRRPVLSAQAVARSELGELLRSRFAYVSPDRAPALVRTSPAANPLQAPACLLQLLQFAPGEAMERLNAAVARAFPQTQLICDASQVVEISLRVGACPDLPADDPRRAARQLSRLPKLEVCDEGLQRFVAIVLLCLLSRERVLLLENADTSLTSFQSRKLGEWLATHALPLGLQMFLAGGSDALLQGLLSAEAETGVVRLRRVEDQVRCEFVAPADARAIEASPLLTAAGGNDRWRAEGLLVVESDVERAIVEALLADNSASRQQLVAINAFGPAFLARLARTLSVLHCPVAVWGHLDLLASIERWQELVEVLTGQPVPRAWLSARERIAAVVEGEFDKESLADNTRELEAFLGRWKAGGPASPPRLADAAKPAASRWRNVRSQGLAAIPPEARGAAEELVDELKRIGLFLSPVGAVRAWFQDGSPTGERHWFEDALLRIRRGACPEPLLAYVEEIRTWLALRGNALA